MAWNEVGPPPNNTSTPFQPQNHNSPLEPQKNQLGPNDIVIQHLQQQALNQTQLYNMLGSILSSQQNLQWETVSLMNEMSKRHENEQFIRDILIFDGKKHYSSMTKGLFSHWTELILISSQAFTRSLTLAFSSVRENGYLNTKLELCWKMLLIYKIILFNFIWFYLILFDIIAVIVIYGFIIGSLLELNQLL